MVYHTANGSGIALARQRLFDPSLFRVFKILVIILHEKREILQCAPHTLVGILGFRHFVESMSLLFPVVD